MPISQTKRHRLRKPRVHTHAVAVLLVGLCPMSAVRAEVAEPVARIPFEIQANRIIFPMKVGDAPEQKILRDTGLTFEGVHPCGCRAALPIASIGFITRADLQ